MEKIKCSILECERVFKVKTSSKNFTKDYYYSIKIMKNKDKLYSYTIYNFRKIHFKDGFKMIAEALKMAVSYIKYYEEAMIRDQEDNKMLQSMPMFRNHISEANKNKFHSF